MVYFYQEAWEELYCEIFIDNCFATHVTGCINNSTALSGVYLHADYNIDFRPSFEAIAIELTEIVNAQLKSGEFIEGKTFCCVSDQAGCVDLADYRIYRENKEMKRWRD